MTDAPARGDIPVTELLVRWRGGDAQALGALIPLVYVELRAAPARSRAIGAPSICSSAWNGAIGPPTRAAARRRRI
jgi:hypothetical protein